MPEELYAKKEYQSLLLKTLGDSPKLRIIDFFLDNPLFDFTKKEVIEALGMSKQTFYKYFKDIEKYGIVSVSRRIGKASLYKINLENPMVKMLKEYEIQLSLQIADQEEAKMQKPVAVEMAKQIIVFSEIEKKFKHSLEEFNIPPQELMDIFLSTKDKENCNYSIKSVNQVEKYEIMTISKLE